MQGHAFFLRPDIPKKGVPADIRYDEEEGFLAEPLRSYAVDAGLVMRRPSLTPYSVYALEATEYAQEQGCFDTFHRATYKALWEDDKDLGDLSVIQEIANACGLNWPELHQRLESGHYKAVLEAQFQQAVDLGIQGIPAFAMGNVLFTGAQPYQVFQEAARQTLHRRES